jgi:predicted nucleotidyltransferase
MDWQQALTAIITRLETVSSVEGAFLSGSLVNEYQDDFSDIDLGIATKNSAKAFDGAFGLRHELLSVVGQPLHHLERGWGHCKMIAALFGKSRFPPIGLEIDIIFSQLHYVAEQMPYSKYRIVFDHDGRLESVLARTSQSKPSQEIENEILQHLKSFPFCAHDALKACKRSDMFQAQSVLEEMRKLIFFAAATRQGEQVYGSKRAYRYLSATEQKILEESYRHSDENTVAQLTQLYLQFVTELESNYQIRAGFENAKTALRELL